MMGTTLDRKWGRRADIKGKEVALREEDLFLCHVRPSLLLLILTYGTLWAAPLGKNIFKNIWTHVLIQPGLPEMTHFTLLDKINIYIFHRIDSAQSLATVQPVGQVQSFSFTGVHMLRPFWLLIHWSQLYFHGFCGLVYNVSHLCLWHAHWDFACQDSSVALAHY